ncbi:MAG TPA: hypothetical protein VED18_11040 [Candidatus Sulfotelmatobacter sp.]|jgi:hypothetical protein|nr:hypothetical protein [Candidatus Sulfotelmatobacter sp.]
MKKRAYTPPTVTRVDLVTHEVALAVCKTNTRKTQPNGGNRTCTQTANPCRTTTSPS